jgi:Family of unknown function (DUF5335)
MGLEKIDRRRWIDVCAAISWGIRGKRAEIEVREAPRQPVLGIAYDPAIDALTIMLDGVDHFVFNPREMYLDFALGEIQSLEILDAENAWQIVVLRDPLRLPGASPIA